MARSAFFVGLVFVLICPGLHPVLQAAVVSTQSDVLATLDRGHPRLLLKDAELEALKQRYAKDTALQKCVKDVLEQADVYSRLAPMPYNKIGPRLLHVSREYVERIYSLALAWRWTGRAVYADRAVENVLAACDFNDWNPSHFLDTAEMSHAMAIGYDWLFDCLDAPARERIKSALLEKGIKPGISVYSGKPFGGFGGWPQARHNWNQVCNGGMLIAALAIADTDVSLLCARLLSLCRMRLVRTRLTGRGWKGLVTGTTQHATRHTHFLP